MAIGRKHGTWVTAFAAAGALTIGGIGLALNGPSAQAKEQKGGEKSAAVVIGTYSPQKAFSGTSRGQEVMKSMREMQKKMREAGKNKNRKKMREMRKQAQKQRQAASSAFDSFRKNVQKAAPKVAEAHGLHAVVRSGRRNSALIYTADDVETKDITAKLVKALNEMGPAKSADKGKAKGKGKK